MAKHPTVVAYEAGAAAGRAFVAGFTRQLPSKRSAAHRARIRRLQRDLAAATARRG